MSKTVAIIQSNYIPWKGYFDVLRAVDEFVLLDSVQYTRRDWRNRNLVKTPHGLHWLTIPVQVKGKYTQSIDATRIQDPAWIGRHLKTIEVNYRSAAAFGEVFPWLRHIYESTRGEQFLARVNERLLRAICERLGIRTPIRRSTDIVDRALLNSLDPTGRIVTLCRAIGAARYLSGPAAKEYLQVDRFSEAGIELGWLNYAGYPEYPQLWGPFEHGVSIIDLLLNTGDDAIKYLKAV